MRIKDFKGFMNHISESQIWMQKNNGFYKLNEIGDRIVNPEITKRMTVPSFTGGTAHLYSFKIGNDTYMAIISIQKAENGGHYILLGFDRPDKYGNIPMEMTHSNMPINILSNVMGAFGQWLIEYPGNETIVSIVFSGKAEGQGDTRRSKIYDTYIKRSIENFGLSIESQEDITDEWPYYVPTGTTTTEYKITPLTIPEIREKSVFKKST